MWVVIWYPSIIGNTINHGLVLSDGETVDRSNMNNLKGGSKTDLVFGRRPGGE
jgi:hypothetical protein